MRFRTGKTPAGKLAVLIDTFPSQPEITRSQRLSFPLNCHPPVCPPSEPVSPAHPARLSCPPCWPASSPRPSHRPDHFQASPDHKNTQRVIEKIQRIPNPPHPTNKKKTQKYRSINKTKKSQWRVLQNICLSYCLAHTICELHQQHDGPNTCFCKTLSAYITAKGG